MPCCGQPAAGYVHRWHLRGLPGKAEPIEHDTQADALATQRANGGKGVVVRVVKKV